MGYAYLSAGLIAMLILFPVWSILSWEMSVGVVVVYLLPHIVLWRNLTSKRGAQLNPILGKTAMLLLVFTTALTAALCLSHL